MQVFLDMISENNELVLNSYLKALKSNGSDRKQRRMKDRGEARFRSALNTPKAQLFMGKMSTRKPKEDPGSSQITWIYSFIMSNQER